VLFATGTANSGLSLFLESDRLVLDYNAFGDHSVLVSEVLVPTGDATVAVRFKRDGAGGDFTLMIDGEDAGTAHVPLAMRIMSSIGHSIGYDYGSQVSPRYHGPNRFAGTLHRLEVLSDRAEPADIEAELAAGMSQQ
jgi:arylsulfatase